MHRHHRHSIYKFIPKNNIVYFFFIDLHIYCKLEQKIKKKQTKKQTNIGSLSKKSF